MASYRQAFIPLSKQVPGFNPGTVRVVDQDLPAVGDKLSILPTKKVVVGQHVDGEDVELFLVKYVFAENRCVYLEPWQPETKVESTEPKPGE